MLSVFFTLCSCWNHRVHVCFAFFISGPDSRSGLTEVRWRWASKRETSHSTFSPSSHISVLLNFFYLCACVCVQSCALPVTEPWAEGQGFSRMSGLSAPPGSAPPHVKLKHLTNFPKVPTKQLCSKASQYMQSVKQCFQCNLGVQ